MKRTKITSGIGVALLLSMAIINAIAVQAGADAPASSDENFKQFIQVFSRLEERTKRNTLSKIPPLEWLNFGAEEVADILETLASPGDREDVVLGLIPKIWWKEATTGAGVCRVFDALNAPARGCAVFGFLFPKKCGRARVLPIVKSIPKEALVSWNFENLGIISSCLGEKEAVHRLWVNFGAARPVIPKGGANDRPSSGSRPLAQTWSP